MTLYPGAVLSHALPTGELVELASSCRFWFDVHVMLSLWSVDSASPVTSSQFEAGTPDEVWSLMFQMVTVAVEPSSTV